MGLVIKIHRADGTLERVISKTGDVDVTFHKGGGHKPFIRFNKDTATDVDFDGEVSVFNEYGTHLETISGQQLRQMR